MSPRLFFQVWSLEVRKRMSYRSEFWTNAVVSFLVEIGVAWFMWAAVFRESGHATIGGFTRDGMVLYYVVAILLGKLVRGEDRESSVAQSIYDGTLTRYLLFPASFFAFKYAERLGGLLPALAQLALFGGLAVFLLDISQVGTITAGSVARTVAAVAVGNVLAFLMTLVLESVAFWADNVWSLEVLVRFLGHLLGGQMLPLHLFPDWMQPVIAILPFRFLYYFPAMTLTGRLDTGEWLSGLAVAVLWCGLLALATRFAWRRGYLTYTGVGI